MESEIEEVGASWAKPLLEAVETLKALRMVGKLYALTTNCMHGRQPKRANMTTTTMTSNRLTPIQQFYRECQIHDIMTKHYDKSYEEIAKHNDKHHDTNYEQV